MVIIAAQKTILMIYDKHFPSNSIADNPFVCDCQVIWFRDWINERKTTEGVNLPRETKCTQPSTSPSSNDHSLKDPGSLMDFDEGFERIPISEVTLTCSGAMGQTTSPPLIHIFSSKMPYKIFLYLNILYSLMFYIVFISNGSAPSFSCASSSSNTTASPGGGSSAKIVRTLATRPAAVPALLMVRLVRRTKRKPRQRQPRRREPAPPGDSLNSSSIQLPTHPPPSYSTQINDDDERQIMLSSSPAIQTTERLATNHHSSSSSRQKAENENSAWIEISC